MFKIVAVKKKSAPLFLVDLSRTPGECTTSEESLAELKVGDEVKVIAIGPDYASQLGKEIGIEGGVKRKGAPIPQIARFPLWVKIEIRPRPHTSDRIWTGKLTGFNNLFGELDLRMGQQIQFTADNIDQIA